MAAVPEAQMARGQQEAGAVYALRSTLIDLAAVSELSAESLTSRR